MCCHERMINLYEISIKISYFILELESVTRLSLECEILLVKWVQLLLSYLDNRLLEQWPLKVVDEILHIQDGNK